VRNLSVLLQRVFRRMSHAWRSLYNNSLSVLLEEVF
jgi:hypothetical protein